MSVKTGQVASCPRSVTQAHEQGSIVYIYVYCTCMVTSVYYMYVHVYSVLKYGVQCQISCDPCMVRFHVCNLYVHVRTCTCTCTSGVCVCAVSDALSCVASRL